MITLLFSMQWHMLRLARFFFARIIGCSIFTTLSCFLFDLDPPPPLLESRDIIIPSFTTFFNGLPTCAKICHTFNNAPLDTTQTCLWSCVGLIVDTWLLACPIAHIFHLSLVHLLITLHTYIGFPNPIIAHMSRCQCEHTINDLGIHLFRWLYWNKHTTSHDTFGILLQLLFWKMEHTLKNVPPFIVPDSVASWCSYHQKQLSNFSGHCHS